MRTDAKIGLIGAGAVGCYIVTGLYDKYGDHFMVVAEGGRRERLERDGLIINGRRYNPRIAAPEEAGAEGLDFLIVAVKYTALRGSLNDIAAAVSEDTCVISLLNGIDSEEIIGARIGMRHMLYAFIRIASARKGNRIDFPLPEEDFGICVGEPSGSQERAEAFRSLFDGTQVVCHVSEDILSGMWDKFALNISRNLPQAVLGVGIGAYEDSRYVEDLSVKLRGEVVALAAARGIIVPEHFFYAPSGKAQRYSTLQDLDAGRETEIEMFSGAMIRMAKETGVPCPYNEAVYDLIKALEEKNAGKFDYQDG